MPTSSDIAIRCRGLGKRFRLFSRPEDRLKEIFLRQKTGREFWSVRGVDLEVRRGETLGIIGRNGSGKSTLLQMLCGTMTPTEGTLEVDGRVAALLELGAGFHPDFTGRENVELSASILGLTKDEIAARMPSIEAFAGIGEFIDVPVRRYSSGMYARLAFSVCAHADADILVIDEILAVGDAGFQQRCMRYLHEFRARGTLIFVSHDEAAVLALCERALWLDAGRVRAAGPARDTCRRYLAAIAEDAGQGESFRRAQNFEQSTAATIPGQTSQSGAATHMDVFDFDPDATWKGPAGATITAVDVTLSDGAAMLIAHGGEDVLLRIEVRADRRLERPVIGFVMRNRFGQNLISDNTYLGCRKTTCAVDAGQLLATRFGFVLPYLPSGAYTLEAYVFDGDHLAFSTVAKDVCAGTLEVSSTHVSTGSLANVIMTHIEIKTIDRTVVNDQTADIL